MESDAYIKDSMIKCLRANTYVSREKNCRPMNFTTVAGSDKGSRRYLKVRCLRYGLVVWLQVESEHHPIYIISYKYICNKYITSSFLSFFYRVNMRFHNDSDIQCAYLNYRVKKLGHALAHATALLSGPNHKIQSAQ